MSVLVTNPSTGIGFNVLSGTTGSVLFIDSSGKLAQDNADLFWDSTNQRFYLNSSTHAATAALTLSPKVTGDANLVLRQINSQSGNALELQDSGGNVKAFLFYDPVTVTTILRAQTFKIQNTNAIDVFSSIDNIYCSIMPSLGTRTEVFGNQALLTVGGSSTGFNFSWAPNASNTANFAGIMQSTVLQAGASNSGGNWYNFLSAIWELGVTGLNVRRLYSGGIITGGSLATYTERFYADSTGSLGLAGKTLLYNGVSTVGWGQPAIYGTGRSTAQTGDVASIATYTVGAADGSFLVSANFNVTAFTSGTQTVTCVYTDETNTSRTFTFTFSNLTGTLLNAIGATGPYEGLTVHIRCKASTAITIKSTGTVWTGTYNVEGYITQIG